MPKGDYRCTQCGIRWVQERGLCRRCSRQTWKVFTSEKERQARLGDKRIGLVRRQDEPMPARSVTVRGCEYEIVWDGSVR